MSGKGGYVMNMICPNCEKQTEVKSTKCTIETEVRGEKLEVEDVFFQCVECGEEFENTNGDDVLEMAYREYRVRHSMLQPEKIKTWRKTMGLTQKELSDVLGWGGATLSRYENGALQTESHEKILRLSMEPYNLRRLIEDTPKALSAEKSKRLITELEAVDHEACSFEMVFQDRLGSYDPDETSGYNHFSLNKLFNAILYFSKDAVLKTKLNKLLFYADFKHFKDYSISITGAKYIHLQYGPVPDKYGYFTENLISDKELEASEVIFGEFSGIEFQAKVNADLSVFSDSELKIMAMVKEYFSEFGSGRIKEFSHNEKAYKETSSNEVITYLYANDLQI